MNPWALVAAFFLTGLILVLALILDPLAKEKEDGRFQRGFPSDRKRR